jgi:hypothetical protein
MNLLAMQLVRDLYCRIALSSSFRCDVIVVFRLKFTMWAYYSEYVKSSPPLSIPKTSIVMNSDIGTIINLILSPKIWPEYCKRSVWNSLPWPPSQDSLLLTANCQFPDLKLDIYWIHMVSSNSLACLIICSSLCFSVATFSYTNNCFKLNSTFNLKVFEKQQLCKIWLYVDSIVICISEYIPVYSMLYYHSIKIYLYITFRLYFWLRQQILQWKQ